MSTTIRSATAAIGAARPQASPTTVGHRRQRDQHGGHDEPAGRPVRARDASTCTGLSVGAPSASIWTGDRRPSSSARRPGASPCTVELERPGLVRSRPASSSGVTPSGRPSSAAVRSESENCVQRAGEHDAGRRPSTSWIANPSVDLERPVAEHAVGAADLGEHRGSSSGEREPAWWPDPGEPAARRRWPGRRPSSRRRRRSSVGTALGGRRPARPPRRRVATVTGHGARPVVGDGRRPPCPRRDRPPTATMPHEERPRAPGRGSTRPRNLPERVDLTDRGRGRSPSARGLLLPRCGPPVGGGPGAGELADARPRRVGGVKPSIAEKTMCCSPGFSGSGPTSTSDDLTGAELLPEQPLRQRILDEALDGPTQRTSAEGRVVALVGEEDTWPRR